MSSSNANFSLPILPILGLIFITLKLTGTISWSWVWVLAPFWVSVLVVIAILLVAGVTWLTIKALSR